MRVFAISRSALLPALLLCCCFGPFDPSNPPPDRIDNGEENPDTSTTTTTLPAGLVAWWTCDDSAGSTLVDSLGKSNGQITGCTRDSGKSGLALKFNGSGDYVSIPPTADSLFEFGTGEFTISVWVKPSIMEVETDSMIYGIITRGLAQERGYGLYIYQNRFSAFVGQFNAGSSNTEFPANANVWRHCVMLRRAGTVELYIDGKKTQSYKSGSNVSTGLYLLIGKDASSERNNLFPGLIDEIKIVDHGWSEADVSKEYLRFN